MSSSSNSLDKVDEHAGIMGYEPKFVDVNGIKTRYYDVGEGPTLVLLHGGNWSGLSTANRWTEAFEYLSEEFRVLAPDRIGCGMTDNPDSIDEYNFENEVKHTLDFIDNMGVDTCHLGGFSRGAGLATCVAVESPDRFKTLIVSNSNTIGPPKGNFKHRWSRIWDGLEDLDPTDPEYLQYNLRQHSYVTDYITEERCRAGAYMSSQPKRVETAKNMEEADSFYFPSGKPIREHIEEAQQEIKNGVLDMPIMYMYGRNGINDPIDMAITAYDIFAETNSDARFKIINHCGHMVMLERPEEYSQTIIDFVDFHFN